ncbi:MAG: 50S ribosomal protein L9 [Candidatus Binatia bacterium]|nr:MAG: 50S ribosomal protein L9 [Candidatus Binatia bacterium]
MEVILKEEVPSLGSIGDIVDVKPGFARNYLFPRGLAVRADPRNRRMLEHEKRVAAEKRDREKRRAEALAAKLSAVRIEIRARAGEEGKLFGAVTNKDVEEALSREGISVDRRRILLEDPIKALGEYEVPVHLPLGVQAKVKVAVLPHE